MTIFNMVFVYCTRERLFVISGEGRWKLETLLYVHIYIYVYVYMHVSKYVFVGSK